ncbi:hypothetical protein [Streptomyces sp. NBC_00073]|uniref:hypothetical protein n=1 Tax=Streptomyces sp. NBC_00073 TaxID=2975640 RepID=UPI002F908ACC
MLAERFRPYDIESLVRIAGALAHSPAAAELPPQYRELAQRVHAEMVAESSGHRSPAVSAFLGPRPGEQVWMLRIRTRHEDTTAPYATKGAALAELAAHVRSSWANVGGQGDVPDEPPADDAEAVCLYYGSGGDAVTDQGFELYSEEIGRAQRCRIVPLDFDFPDALTAEVLNRGAVLYAADDDGPQCIEVAGVLVFGYVDAEDGVVRVSVHLDSADPEHVVRRDGSVPLRVVVEDTVVLDDSNPLRPVSPRAGAAPGRRRPGAEDRGLLGGGLGRADVELPGLPVAQPTGDGAVRAPRLRTQGQGDGDRFAGGSARPGADPRAGGPAMTEKPYPPAPRHLRAACVHPSGHLTSHGSRTTLQVYLGDGLVYRYDSDNYRLPPELAQAQGVGPYFITGAGRRAILNDSQLAAIDSADEYGALRDVSWPTAAALARLTLVEYRDADGAPQPTDGDDGRIGPKHQPFLTPAGIDAARAATPQP